MRKVSLDFLDFRLTWLGRHLNNVSEAAGTGGYQCCYLGVRVGVPSQHFLRQMC